MTPILIQPIHLLCENVALQQAMINRIHKLRLVAVNGKLKACFNLLGTEKERILRGISPLWYIRININKGACWAIIVGKLCKAYGSMNRNRRKSHRRHEATGGMILYAVDKEHMVITAKPVKNLEEKAITKMQVKVVSEKTNTSFYFLWKYTIFTSLKKRLYDYGFR